MLLYLLKFALALFTFFAYNKFIKIIIGVLIWSIGALKIIKIMLMEKK